VSLVDRGIKPPPRTKFETWLDSLNENNKAVVLGWLHDPTYTIADVLRMIHDDDADDDFTGYSATKETISGWRRANAR
jgi:hypothetical protein